MSYDSVRMLEEARSKVHGGIFPTTPVYLLRLFDSFGFGPTLMILTQNTIILLCVASVLRMLGANLIVSTIAIAFLISMPTVLGCMLVLWKDVTLASFLMLSITLIFWASLQKDKNIYFQMAKLISLLLLIGGTWIRFNALTSTAIILFYWLFVFFRDHKFKFQVVGFISIAIFMVISNKVINSYSFPNFQRFHGNNIVLAIMRVDFIGISSFSRVSLIPINSAGKVSLPKSSINNIHKIYSSLGGQAMKHNNKRFGNIVKVYPPNISKKDIYLAWIKAIINHPFAYIRFRWDLFSEIIGATNHRTFEPTHYNRIDGNPFGIKSPRRSVTGYAIKYIKWSSGVFWGKPWFVFSLSIISVFLLSWRSSVPRDIKLFSYFSFLAALSYIIPFFIISGTGEVRYCFPAIILCCNSILVYAISLIESLKEVQ